MNLSPRGIAKIIDWETGGERYYDRHPEWPGEASGITIGVGWDLGHTHAGETTRAWSPHVDKATLEILVALSGHRGEAAQVRLPHVRHLVIPWAAAQTFLQVHCMYSTMLTQNCLAVVSTTIPQHSHSLKEVLLVLL